MPQREREAQQRAVIRRGMPTRPRVPRMSMMPVCRGGHFAQDEEEMSVSSLVYQRSRREPLRGDRPLPRRRRQSRSRADVRAAGGAGGATFLRPWTRSLEKLLYPCATPTSSRPTGAEITVATRKPGELGPGRRDGRAQRLPVRRWVEIRPAQPLVMSEEGAMAHQVSTMPAWHLPRVFVGGEEIRHRRSNGPGGRVATGEVACGLRREKGQPALPVSPPVAYLMKRPWLELCKRAPRLSRFER